MTVPMDNQSEATSDGARVAREPVVPADLPQDAATSYRGAQAPAKADPLTSPAPTTTHAPLPAIVNAPHAFCHKP
jgi:hypothetical protein